MGVQNPTIIQLMLNKQVNKELKARHTGNEQIGYSGGGVSFGILVLCEIVYSWVRKIAV